MRGCAYLYMYIHDLMFVVVLFVVCLFVCMFVCSVQISEIQSSIHHYNNVVYM